MESLVCVSVIPTVKFPSTVRDPLVMMSPVGLAETMPAQSASQEFKSSLVQVWFTASESWHITLHSWLRLYVIGALSVYGEKKVFLLHRKIGQWD